MRRDLGVWLLLYTTLPVCNSVPQNLTLDPQIFSMLGSMALITIHTLTLRSKCQVYSSPLSSKLKRSRLFLTYLNREYLRHLWMQCHLTLPPCNILFLCALYQDMILAYTELHNPEANQSRSPTDSMCFQICPLLSIASPKPNRSSLAQHHLMTELFQSTY